MSEHSEHVAHCPFLNRSDPRCCESSFKLNRLSHALEHCFDRYQSCSVYQELLSERRAKHANLFVQLTIAARNTQQKSAAA